MSLPVPADQLLANLQALRLLARRLTQDAAAADDAVQDTMVAALTNAAPRGSLRPWLASILRHVLAANARAAQSRARREHRHSSAAPTDHPSAAEVAGELQLQRRLIELMQDLEESSRQALFLRYWRGMTPPAIGALLGVPLKTVHSRIERGLQRLRGRLDEGSGGRAGWLPLLLAWQQRERQVSAVAVAGTGGLLLMKTKFAALLVLVCLAWWLPWSAWTDHAATGNAPLPPASPGPVPMSVALPAESPPQRIAVEVPAAVDAVATAPVVVTVAGRVLDLAGRPVGAVDVAFAESRPGGELARVGSPLARTGADGTFSVPVPERKGCFEVVHDEWVAVLRPWLPGRAPDEAVIVVVAPKRRYGGTVVDAVGNPVAAARVRVIVDDVLVPTKAAGEQVLALPHDLGVIDTDEHGAFVLEGVGYVPGARLTATRPALGRATVPLPEVATPDLRLQLRGGDDRKLVFGIVIDPRSRPVAGALVAAAGASAHTDADGTFAVPWGHGRRPAFVRALHRRFGVAEVALRDGVDQPGWDPERPVTLQLPSAPARLTGRVLDHSGQPAAGVAVWTPDLTYLGQVARQEHGHELHADSSVEEQMTEGNPRLSLATTTDADGGFVLGGVFSRPYALFALSRATLAAAGPVTANPDAPVTLTLEPPAQHLVAGRVRTAAGHPIAGIGVTLTRQLAWPRPQRDSEPWSGAPLSPLSAARHFTEPVAATDAEGRFSVPGLHVANSSLVFHGDSLLLPFTFPLAARPDLGELDIVLPAASRFRIGLVDPREADAFSLTTKDGQHVTTLVRVEGFEMSMGRVDLVDGRSPEVAAEARETIVVLHRGRQEVRRIPLLLPAGSGHELRL